VVSVRIEALKKSKLNDLLYFYDGDSSETIANAIKSVDFNEPNDGRARLNELNELFVDSIKNLLLS
jgi:hypothetical protein